MTTTGSARDKALTYLRIHANPPVFLISAGVILAFLIVGVAFPEATKFATGSTQGFIAGHLGRFYILTATFFLVFVVAVMISPWGRRRLGPEDSKPEFGTWSWFAMVFTTGMGIGLVYAGVHEPASHLEAAPISADPRSEQAATEAMNFTFYHWGLHPWAIYIVLGLAMGYLCHREGLPLRPASVLYPLFGNRIYGWPGNLVDILAVFVTLFGLATSLGLGAQQINAGLTELFGLPDNIWTGIVIVSLITAVAVTSLMLGIDRGIRRLSVINMWLALLFMVFIFAVGPKLYILSGMADYTGFYLQNLVWTSFEVHDPQTPAGEWQVGSTLFYWGWWLSWTPFVGMFIAKISYGRTIRQFIAGTLLAPAGISLVWFSILGGSALFYEQLGATDIAGSVPELAVFTLLNQLTAGILTTLGAVIVIVLVLLFFASSSDAASLVVDTITNGDDQDPIKLQRLGWAVAEGAVAAMLLFVGGKAALDALQAAAVAAGLPIAVLLLITCVGLFKALLTARE